ARTIRSPFLGLKKRKRLRSHHMAPFDCARPAVESISIGVAFEPKRIAESVVERRRRVCRLGPRTENAGSWKCTWCGHANVRQREGLDNCSACNAETFTYF